MIKKYKLFHFLQKLNLPKKQSSPSKPVDLRRDYKLRQRMEMALTREKNRIRDYVQFAVSRKKPIESKYVLLDKDHPYHNPLITHPDRLKLFHEVSKELKLGPDTPIINNHKDNSSIQLSIPQLNKSEVLQKGGNMKKLSKKDNLVRLFQSLKKVDPKTRLPGVLFQKKAAPGVDPQKFESCVRQVKEKQKGKVNPYAVCNAALKKESIYKDDKPHPIGSAEERAHSVVEQGASFKEAIKDLKVKGSPHLKRFFEHIRQLKDKRKHRSPENVLIDRTPKKK